MEKDEFEEMPFSRSLSLSLSLSASLAMIFNRFDAQNCDCREVNADFHLFCCRKSCGTRRTSIFLLFHVEFSKIVCEFIEVDNGPHTRRHILFYEIKIEKKSFSYSLRPTVFFIAFGWGKSMAPAKDGFTSLSSINAVLQVLNYLLVDGFPWGMREKTVTNSLKSVYWPDRLGGAA